MDSDKILSRFFEPEGHDVIDGLCQLAEGCRDEGYRDLAELFWGISEHASDDVGNVGIQRIKLRKKEAELKRLRAVIHDMDQLLPVREHASDEVLRARDRLDSVLNRAEDGQS